MVTQLNTILEAIGVGQEVDTSTVGPTAQVIPLENVMREDITRAGIVSRGGAGQRATPRGLPRARPGRPGGGPLAVARPATRLAPARGPQLTEVADLLRAREVSSEDLTRACLDRIARDGGRLNTFLAVREEARPRRTRRAADRALAREGDPRPLLGMPYALKDIFVTRALDDAGVPSPMGCRRPPGPGSWRAIARRTAPPPKSGCTPRVPCFWARRTAMSSPWAPRTRTRRTDRSATLGRDHRAGRLVGWLLRRSRRRAGVFRTRAPIPAGASGSPHA